MAGEAITQPRQAPRHWGAQQQRRGIHCARTEHHDLRVNLVIAGLPRRRITLCPRGLGGDTRGERLLADRQHLAARDHFHAVPLGARQLHAVRALLGLIGTALNPNRACFQSVGRFGIPLVTAVTMRENRYSSSLLRRHSFFVISSSISLVSRSRKPAMRSEDSSVVK